jgi:hypothetical protein
VFIVARPDGVVRRLQTRRIRDAIDPVGRRSGVAAVSTVLGFSFRIALRNLTVHVDPAVLV